MKFSVLAVITAATAGIQAVPLDNGPIGHLQARASDAIGGVVSFIRREEVGHPVVPHQLRRSVVRFHNARDEENLHKRKDGDGKKGDPPVPPLNPFGTKGERSISEEGTPDLTRRKGPEESVPPLAPFSTKE
ncbi:hypothetical protein CTRI78_v006505 [Colletotrichum trifolii]|uniref:Uncharacterized protein n=1 Tax=Colletotrichum trifolii TaxID=5466 RepID=A0A4R8RCB9_COLTR|nr:hypothetical protein CTRI78_v006505 [Colletotrichum trifolii]